MNAPAARTDAQIVQLAAFRVGDEEYVLDIMRVREIIRMHPITPVRKGPKFVAGVINLRGAVIPVLDMRRRFDLESSTAPHRKIMIVLVDGRTVGLIVDQVTEVVRVPRQSILSAPGLLEDTTAPFFSGVCYYKSRTLVLLNIRAVISSNDPIERPVLAAAR